MDSQGLKKRCLELEKQLEQQEIRNKELTELIQRGESAGNSEDSATPSAIQLENKIRERTTELNQALTELKETNEKLSSAKMIADAANKAKSAFLANMSHEIRTPLSAIIGFSDLLQYTEMTEAEKQNTISMISKSGKHLLNIINDILDLSKIEAEKLDVEKIKVNLFEIVEDIKSFCQLNAQGKALSFNIDYLFPLPKYITTDAIRLKQILLNLANNAIKFTKQGGVRIRVRFVDDEQMVAFDVIDTGIGVSKEHREKLFQPFGQGDETTTRKFGGTGLGLYISKLLAEKLGGTITLESTKGIGSIFTATVDSGTVDMDKLVSSVPEATDEENKSKSIQIINTRGSILLVDDSEENQELFSIYLEKVGAKVSLAGNGLQALEMANSKKFDLILMDVQMPVMDGIEATKRLRKSGLEIPIIALTANALKSETNQYIQSGFTDCLIKPVERVFFCNYIAEKLSYFEN